MRVKEESEKAGLKLSIQKTTIIASSRITLWQINGKKVETVAEFLFLGSKITVDGDCSHKIKRCLLLGRKAMTHLDSVLLFFLISVYLFIFYFTILYWFCHTLTWSRHGCTCVPHPEPASHLPPHTIPLGHPSAPAPSILYHASNLDWWFVSYIILYMLQCHSPKSSYPLPLPQSPKDCSMHLCLFCCLA